MTDNIRIPLSGDDPVSTEVIRALATLTETPPSELPPLYKSLNPHTLDALFAEGTGEYLRFTYHDTSVHLRRINEGAIRLSLDNGGPERESGI